MKKKSKVLFLSLASCVACAALAIATPSVVGYAAEEATEEPVFGFYMVDGAAVRVNTGENVATEDVCTGISFTTNITQDYYTNTLKATYTTATSFVLTTEIAPATGTYNAKKYEWTLSDTMAYVDGVRSFRAALDYSDLTEEQRVKALALDLKATSYITVLGEEDAVLGTVETETKATEDTVRSMRGVAVDELLVNPETEDKETLEAYLGENETGASEETVYIETSEETAFEGDYTAAYWNAEKIAESNLGGEELAGVELGAKGNLVLFDDANNYKIVPFQYVTKAIETYDDLESILITQAKVEATAYTFDGYYALAKDLDFLGSEYAVLHDAGFDYKSGLSHHSNNTEMGLIGTFDGNGHTLSVKLGWYGLFGKFGAGATIKNLILNAQFETANTYTSRGTSVLAYKSTAAATINKSSVENVWINILEDNSEGKSNPSVINTISKYVEWKNLVVSYNSEKITYDLTKNGGIFCNNDSNISPSTDFTNNTSNCYVISSTKIALGNLLTGTYAGAYYASNDQDTVKYYKNFKRLEKLSDIVNEDIYADWVWEYDTETGKIVLK